MLVHIISCLQLTGHSWIRQQCACPAAWLSSISLNAWLIRSGGRCCLINILTLGSGRTHLNKQSYPRLICPKHATQNWVMAVPIMDD